MLQEVSDRMKGKKKADSKCMGEKVSVTRLYDYLRRETRWSRETIATFCFYADLLFWLVVGCILGSLISLVMGSHDYVNLVFGTGAFMAIVLGVIVGLIRIFLHAGEG